MPETRLGTVKVEDCIPTPDNPRVLNRACEAYQKLRASVKANGVMVPVHVRPHPEQKGKWDLRAGERRHAVASELGIEHLPAIIHEGMSDDEALDVTVVENFGREDLLPVEEARALKTLLERCGGDHAAVASRIGHTERWVRSRVKLCDLSPEWQKAATDPASVPSAWSPAHLALVARFPPEAQRAILREVSRWGGRVRALTVRALEKWLAERFQRRLADAPWDVGDERLLRSAPACTKCRKRSALQGLLFHGTDEERKLRERDQCLDAACWKKKFAAHLKAVIKAARKEHKDLLVLSESWYAGGEMPVSLSKDRYNWRRCGSKAAGARAAIYVDGPHAGELVWVSKDAAERATRRDAGPTPLKERRARLRAKRLAKLLEEVRARLAESTVEDLVYEFPANLRCLVRLAAVFGAEEARAKRETVWRSWLGWKDKVKRVAALEGDLEAAMEALWDRIKPNLDLALRCGLPKTKTPPEYLGRAKWAAALIGLDGGEMLREISRRKGFIEPASWAALNADGTPKRRANRQVKAHRRKKVA